MISILLVDDQALIRTAVSQLLAGEPDLDIVGEAADGRQAVETAHRTRPDIVLMDIRMPRMDGIQATESIRADPALTESKVIILTTFEEDENVLRALQAGASGFIGKGAEADELVAAIRTVHAGEALLSPRATRALIDRYLHPVPPPAPRVSPALDALTEREREILVLVGRGLSNDDIARELVISPQTAKTHINRTMTKLYAHDRAQLVIIAYETGLLTPGDRGPRR